MDSNTTDRAPVSTRGSRRRPRGRGIRVRTGCFACRKRHLKCDETKPVCRTCQKTSRDCVYPYEQSQPDDIPCEPASNAADHARVRSFSKSPGQDSASTEHGSAEKTVPTIASAHEAVNTVATSTEPLDDAGEQTVVCRSPSTVRDVRRNHLLQHDNDSIISGANATYLTDVVYGFGNPSDGLEFPDVYDAELFGISPESSFGGWPTVSAEIASQWWFNLLAADANNSQSMLPYVTLERDAPGLGSDHRDLSNDGTLAQTSQVIDLPTRATDAVVLTDKEIQLMHHYVTHLSIWMDVTDPAKQFAIIVPDLALRNQGLANAILALSSLHLSIEPHPQCCHSSIDIDPTMAVQYYNETLHFLQHEMANAVFLRSDELLATVLIISTYEMLETKTLESAWDKHLQGVFWIQRSQTIHGESEGLKQRIWWAWLRQDIFSAFRRRRQILSFYKMTRDCSTLDFWDLVDRAVYLLGQCVNYASMKEEENGRSDIRKRLNDSAKMWEKLNEFSSCFEKYDRRLPTRGPAGSAFTPVWINPAAASLAVQVHNFSKLLLLEYTPAIGGMKELKERQKSLQRAVDVICGIACCTEDTGAVIMSTQCVFAAGHHVQDPAKRDQVLQLLRSHRQQTGWPHYDLASELESDWSNANDVI